MDEAVKRQESKCDKLNDEIERVDEEDLAQKHTLQFALLGDKAKLQSIQQKRDQINEDMTELFKKLAALSEEDVDMREARLNDLIKGRLSRHHGNIVLFSFLLNCS